MSVNTYKTMADFIDGRKIPTNLENPIDNVLIDIGAYLNHFLRKIGVTPNMLTFASFASGLLCVWFLYDGKFLSAVLCLFISYLFDCMDGNMARKYDMVSDFGDWFDHITDIVVFLLIFIVITFNRFISLNLRFTFMATITVLSFMMLVHMGCQELAYDKKNNDSLSAIEVFCPYKDAIVWTRFFGVGTWTMALLLFFVAFHVFKSKTVR